ncbi:hypothetical protein LCGC14_1187910 [marine sediment metagenome]|uniref:VRR-NUC domain-containing protein n=1 Tax=marine sediment metagenome TaxID=412755 RepID=A0A0F9M7Y0_9ZZZZ
MKRQTKSDKFRDLANAVSQINNGEKVRRIGAKDGSIATHPVVPVDPTKSEKAVLAECLSWIQTQHVMRNRHDAGTFQNNRGQYGTYGILGSGDIHGMLRHHGGKHFEIETKRGKGGRLSKDQQRRKVDVEYNNGLYFVVHGLPELIHYMQEWI